MSTLFLAISARLIRSASSLWSSRSSRALFMSPVLAHDMAVSKTSPYSYGAGLGGLKDTGKVRLKPGQALGYQGTFQLPTSTAIIVGRYFVALDEQDVDRTTYEVVVAPMGASTSGRAVARIQPAEFLAA